MKRILLCCFLFAFIGSKSNAQSNFLNINQLIEYFDQYHSSFPREHVYVHTDRSYYTPGDDIWFKGYITLGNFNRLSNLSNVVYIDLIDGEDVLIESLQLPVSEGIAIGDFALPVSLSSGTYRIRAYTNWMRNFDQTSFFEREIRILNSLGNRVHNKGIIKTTASGYHENNSLEKSKPIHNQDYGIAVNNFLDHSIIVEVQIDSNNVNGQELHFLIQHDGEVFIADKLNAEKASILLTVPRKVLGDGVNELVLLSKDMELLAQRNIFSLLPTRQLSIQLKANKERYSPREKVKVGMSISSESESLKIGSFSVSVTHQGKVPDGKERNKHIVSSLLLPNTFALHEGLLEKNVESIQELDRLVSESAMSDIWSEIANRKRNFAVENDLKISGVVQKMNGKPESNAVVTLFSPDATFFLDTIADSEGHFQFDKVIYDESARFVIQAATDKGSRNLNIVMDSVEAPAIIKRSGAVDSLLDEEDKFYVNKNRERADFFIQSASVKENILLNAVKMEGISRRGRVKHSANLNGPGNADQILYAEELERCFSLESCLPALLVGVSIGGGVAYSHRSPHRSMKLIVDGIHRQDDDLLNIKPYDIETIEVLRSGAKLAIYGSFAGGGLLIITTKGRATGDLKKEDTPGIVAVHSKGFSKTRSFVSPNYSLNEQAFDNKDIRATIYWDANIISDEKGESFFEFYTSDEPGRYRVVVEGIDLEGRLGYTSMEFEVKLPQLSN